MQVDPGLLNGVGPRPGGWQQGPEFRGVLLSRTPPESSTKDAKQLILARDHAEGNGRSSPAIEGGHRFVECKGLRHVVRPADALLDFYNEVAAAVQGRLEVASTLARINDALKDIFACFTIAVNPTTEEGTIEGVVVTPLLPPPETGQDLPAYVERAADDGFIADPNEGVAPPLRALHVEASPELTITQA